MSLWNHFFFPSCGYNACHAIYILYTVLLSSPPPPLFFIITKFKRYIVEIVEGGGKVMILCHHSEITMVVCTYGININVHFHKN